MVVMLHYRGNNAQLCKVKDVSVNDDGFFCSLDHTPEEVQQIIAGLNSQGFDARLVGRLVTMPLTGFSVFEETKIKKD